MRISESDVSGNKNRSLAVGIFVLALLIISGWNFVSDYLRYENPPDRFKTLTKDEYVLIRGATAVTGPVIL
ncbi:MAG: hypothetical protein VB078_01250 [Clostridiaceae bacterium]|nr:hypothetical protein [Clostridiaceae bacterium]